MLKTVGSLKLLPVKHQRALGLSQNHHFRHQNSIKIGSKIGPAAEPSPEPVFSDFGLQNAGHFRLQISTKIGSKIGPAAGPSPEPFSPIFGSKTGAQKSCCRPFLALSKLDFLGLRFQIAFWLPLGCLQPRFGSPGIHFCVPPGCILAGFGMFQVAFAGCAAPPGPPAF